MTGMKILSISPPAPFLFEEKVFVDLGILGVDAALEQAGINVTHLDLLGRKDYLQAVQGAIGQQKFDTILITSTTPQLPKAFALLDAIKQVDPNQKIYIGGAHATLLGILRQKKIMEFTNGNPSLLANGIKERLYNYDPNFKSLESFDKIFVGEGEEQIINAIHSGDKWAHMPNVNNIDALPPPARHLVNMDEYKWFLETPNGNIRGTNVMTQRGCPFRCYFCSGRLDSVGGKSFQTPFSEVRMKSPENAVKELDMLHEKHGYEAFMFYDDEFNLVRDRTLAFCKLLEKRNYKWRAFIKSELFVRFPEVAEAMAKAGCVEVCTGVESGSERILRDIIKKNTTPEINGKAIEVAHKVGMTFKAFTIIGHASETYEDLMLTKQWILKYRPDNFDVTILQPYPGSPVYDNLEKYKNIFFYKKLDFSKEMAFYKGVPGEYAAFVSTPTLTSEQLVKIRDEIDRDVRAEMGLKSLQRESPAKQMFDHAMGQPGLAAFGT